MTGRLYVFVTVRSVSSVCLCPTELLSLSGSDSSPRTGEEEFLPFLSWVLLSLGHTVTKGENSLFVGGYLRKSG